MKHYPYWWEEAAPQSAPQRDINSECDVAIVGAGYTGLTAALTLAIAGKSVQVFDKDKIGAGASSRNGGITSGSLRLSLAQAIKRYGEEKGCRIFIEAQTAREHLKSLIDEHKIDCDYALPGVFLGALTQSDFDAMKRETEFLHSKTGLTPTIVDSSMLESYVGSAKYVGGIVNDTVGTIHPGKLVAGLGTAASKAGALIHAETAVLRINKHSGTFRISTDRGTCTANDVIVATNGYTDASDKWLRRRLVPIKSRIVVTEELSTNLVHSLMPQARAMGERRKLYRYFRPTPDGKRILMGGREPPFSNKTDIAIDHGCRALTSIFPQLDGVELSHSWSGNVAFSRNAVPQFFTHEGIHYAVGYCGSGTVWAPWLGKKAALKILGDADAQTQFETSPPPSVPFYNGKPWFIPAVIAGYGLQDWWNLKK
jgi:glycine/D-amino acid oxidase-like deaminating enzyme